MIGTGRLANSPDYIHDACFVASKSGLYAGGNVWIVSQLLDGIEKVRQPRGNMYNGRAVPEAVLEF